MGHGARACLLLHALRTQAREGAVVSVNASVAPEDVDRLESQQDRLLARLRVSPVTNIEAMETLRIFNLSARTSELRKAGFNVIAKRLSKGVWEYSLAPAPAFGQLTLAGVAPGEGR
jgi:hypothetical protein